MSDSDKVSQGIDTATLARLGIIRLNLGSGVHVSRDYGDTASLYVDVDDPPPASVPCPLDPQLVIIEGRFVYLQRQIPPLPFESNSIREVLCEHLIEHLAPLHAAALCREVRRVLAPGGVFRISTPDLRTYINAFDDSGASVEFRATRWQRLAQILPALPEQHAFNFLNEKTEQESAVADLSGIRPAFLINQLFRLWGHQWIYDFDELVLLMETAGFPSSHVRRVAYREGRHSSLAKWDNPYRADESLYAEITVL